MDACASIGETVVAHRMLESSWIGTTDFRETVECIDDDDDDIDDEVKIENQ